MSRIIDKDLAEIASQLVDYYDLLSGRSILIAGGAGFLGRYLVSTLDHLNSSGLLEKPCTIIIADNFVSGTKSWIPKKPEVVLVEHDISQPLHFEGPIHYIINAASIASPVFYNRLRLETIDAGILGTKNLLELARQKRVQSFLFLSSSEIYGDPPSEFIPTSEEYFGNVSCIGPRACYDEPKRIGETLCVNYAEVYNLPVKIARPFNIFGPGIRLDDGRVMPTFVVAAINGETLPVHGDGTKTRTFCYISNAIVGFFQILLSSHNREVFNIGIDEPEIQIKTLADTIHELVMNEESKVNLVQPPTEVYATTNPNRRCPDLSRIRSLLGYHPRIDLATGLRRFIAWTREELDASAMGTRMETRCRVCQSEGLKPFLSLGETPLANNLLAEDSRENPAELYPLEVLYCPGCHNCQLSCTVAPEKLFNHYPYVTSTTATFRKHFAEMASDIISTCRLSPGSLVVDIGSNDGLLLGNLRDLGMNVVGVEPASNIAGIARKGGIDTICDYFNPEVVQAIRKVKGRADLVSANNVLAHVAEVHNFIHDIKALLKDDGLLVVEVQYLLDTIRTLTFDNIYHEHVSYFSVLSLSELFRRQEMELVDVRHVESHGGSLRAFVQKRGGLRPLSPSVGRFIEEERHFGLDDFATYEAFAAKVHDTRNTLNAYVRRIKENRQNIVGYGAPAKATTLLNFCGITADQLDYVVDDNPLKQGMFIPGVNVPIRSRDALSSAHPDNILVLAWNFADEIIAKNEALRQNGTRFVIPLPEPRIV